MSESTTESQEWTNLCTVDGVPSEGGRYVKLNGLHLAVFKHADGGIRVIDDNCPHAGASLSGGKMHGDIVVCPWHGWSFNAKTGDSPDVPGVCVAAYESRIEGSMVQAKLPTGDDSA